MPKQGKVSFRKIFWKRGSVMPIADEEEGHSQTQRQEPSGACVESTTGQDSLNLEVHANVRNTSRTSLPPCSTGKPKLKSILVTASSNVRSIATPPREHTSVSSFITKVNQAESENNNDHSKESQKPEPQNYTVLKKTASVGSSSGNFCRICHDTDSKQELLTPCLCKGSMGVVHQSCLERWLGESGKNSCEICGYEYVTKRVPKYTGLQSVFKWLRHPVSPMDIRNVVFDLACFCILTPLAAISAWLCLLGALHYTFEQDPRKGKLQQNETSFHTRRNMTRYDSAANSTWTSVGLLTLTGTLVCAYLVWLIVAFRFHLEVFRDWRSKNFVVTIQTLSPEEQATVNEVRNAVIAFRREQRGEIEISNNNNETDFSSGQLVYMAQVVEEAQQEQDPYSVSNSDSSPPYYFTESSVESMGSVTPNSMVGNEVLPYLSRASSSDASNSNNSSSSSSGEVPESCSELSSLPQQANSSTN